MFNTLLQDQLQKHFGELDKIPDSCLPVLNDISDSYSRFETEIADSRKASNDLIKINKELDQFAYVVSHDLKAPLRAIMNLSTWIEEDLGSSAGEDVTKNMQILRGRVKRMESLIAGILEYSRVGRQVDTIELLDTGKVVKEAIELLTPPESFIITVQNGMPQINADKTKLQQVFSNLISNAVKYHHTQQGKIEITCNREGQFYRFSISDDGPGIAPQYHQSVFEIFQTLQARDKVESTGIGLTIVKKIVEEAGGRIWIESETGKGATFHFLWPS
jgi:light-regulated signal transduction histidine kinase (bacteriophytochrome)